MAIRVALVPALLLLAGSGAAEHNRVICEDESREDNRFIQGCTDAHTWGGATIDLIVHDCTQPACASEEPQPRSFYPLGNEAIDIEFRACSPTPGTVILAWQRTFFYALPTPEAREVSLIMLEETGDPACPFMGEFFDRSRYQLFDYPNWDRFLAECVHASVVLHAGDAGGIAHGRGCTWDSG